MTSKKKKRVVMAMSGGVDSSTAAGLLVQEGYDVIGITCKFFDEKGDGVFPESSCCGLKGVDDARRVCHELDIPYYVLNFKKQFETEVIDYFCDEYLHARTPNPCIACNERMKWGFLLEKARIFEADFLATGHYARVEYDSERKRYLLRKGLDPKKEQTYFLYFLTQDQLQYTLFPLGHFTKDEVREKARAFGLKVHNKPGSQEICFIPDNDYKKFLNQRLPFMEKQGSIINSSGIVLGKHKGLAHYTIGQRKGLGISAPKPLYVVSMDLQDNTLIVGEEPELYAAAFIVDSLNWISIPSLKEPMSVQVGIRYNHAPADAVLTPGNDSEVHVAFSIPQKAITPGQAAVFYEGDSVIGGGIIKQVLSVK